MNIFQYNENPKSYTCPVVKTIIFISLIIANVCKGYFIQIDNKIAYGIVAVLSGIIGIISIYCATISLLEIGAVYENRHEEKTSPKKAKETGKPYSVDKIISMAEENDIIEILIVANGKILEIGSSSDNEVGSAKFFDKRYYIDKKEYENIDDFKSALMPYSAGDKISVYAIDGIKAK